MITQNYEWKDFDNLKRLKGNEYRVQRDSIIATTSDLETKLQNYLKSTDWEDVIHSKILLAWSKHRLLYTDVLKRLNNVDVATVRQNIIGMNQVFNEFALDAQTKWGTSILPLCWEQIMKFHHEIPDWHIITYIQMIETVPDSQSIDPLLFFIANHTNLDLQRYAGRILRSLPKQDLILKIPPAIKTTTDANAIHILTHILKLIQ